MERLDLTYKLVDINIKSKALDKIYFISQIFQEHSQEKIRKRKLRKFIYFGCHFFPLRTGGCCNPPLTFFTGKIYQKCFIDTWVFGQRVGKLA